MRRTILLADDSPTIQRLVANIFADLDLEIVSVSNGDAAIRKFDEIRPHLVMTDIYMPGKNGYEVCLYVRQHPAAGTTPVVLLVGAFDAFDEEKAREIGATAHITKPFEPQALISLVQDALTQAETNGNKVPSVAKSETPPQEPSDDLLGLEALFTEATIEGPAAASAISDGDLDRIAERVIQKISTQIVENIAWEIVPDITEKIVREEMKRINER